MAWYIAGGLTLIAAYFLGRLEVTFWRVTAAFVDRGQSPTGWRHDDARNQWVLA